MLSKIFIQLGHPQHFDPDWQTDLWLVERLEQLSATDNTAIDRPLD